jgi:GntR family phosphonate transport system transcriptional regulator
MASSTGQHDEMMTSAPFTASYSSNSSRMPLHEKLADTLATEIKDRLYTETGRLPSENQLTVRFGVNRHVLRQALSTLQTNGLIKIEPGRGAFVQHELMDYALSQRTRFTENLQRQGFLPSKQLLTALEMAAPERVAHHLKLMKDAKVFKVEMLDEANDQPVAVATAYYPAVRFAGLLNMLNDGTRTTEILRHFGVTDYVRAESRITAQMPSQATARLLKQPDNRPVLCVECLDIDMDGEPIKFGETIFCGDRVQMSVATADDGLSKK